MLKLKITSTKLTLVEVPPFSLAFLRTVISTFLVFAIFSRRNLFGVKRDDLPKLVLAGLLGSVFNLIFFFLGVRLTSAISTQTIFTISPVLWENHQNFDWVSHLGPIGVLGILYQGIFASVLAFLAYQTGLALTSAFAAGVILYLNPIVTTLVAVPILKEKITLPFLIGAVLIVVGSIIATQLEMVKNHFRKKI